MAPAARARQPANTNADLIRYGPIVRHVRDDSLLVGCEQLLVDALARRRRSLSPAARARENANMQLSTPSTVRCKTYATMDAGLRSKLNVKTHQLGSIGQAGLAQLPAEAERSLDPASHQRFATPRRRLWTPRPASVASVGT